MAKTLKAKTQAAKAAQLEAMRKAAEAGDTFVAYWLSSASTSVAFHYQHGAVKEVRA
jgi:soluble cytochrome b562